MTRLIESMSVKVPSQHSDFLDELIGRAPFSKQKAPFTHFYDVLVFAATLGFQSGIREPLAKAKGKDPIPYSTMSSNKYFEALLASLVVLNGKDDHKCLSGDSAASRIELFEQYACAGLTILKNNRESCQSNFRIFVETSTIQKLASLASELESEISNPDLL